MVHSNAKEARERQKVKDIEKVFFHPLIPSSSYVIGNGVNSS
jgi:hypothetical protein